MKLICAVTLIGLALTTTKAWSQSDAGVITRCALQYEVNISSQVARDVEQNLRGAASLDFNSFVALFPESDRLAAYRLFTGCLSKEFETSNNGVTVNLNSPIEPIDKPIPSTLTSGKFRIFEYINGLKEIPMRFPSVCDVVITKGNRHQVGTSFVMRDASTNAEIANSRGNNLRHNDTSRVSFIAPPIELVFSFKPANTSEAGFAHLVFDVDCS